MHSPAVSVPRMVSFFLCEMPPVTLGVLRPLTTRAPAWQACRRARAGGQPGRVGRWTDPRVGSHTPTPSKDKKGASPATKLPVPRAAYPVPSPASRPQSAFMPSTNVDAQAVATSERYFSLTLSTQPASMTKLSR